MLAPGVTRRWRGRFASYALFLTSLLVASSAAAQSRTPYFIEQLKTNDDYRVRTQAALALGASNEDIAVQPLCDALGADGNISVRVASAAALGKLGKPAALPCLQTASAKESAASVKSQIDKSIAGIQNAGGAAPPPPGADTKYYVALQITNKTTRAATEIETLARTALQAKILSKKGFAVAPKTETIAQGGQIVKSKNLKGWFLIASVEPPVYDASGLTQVVRVTMFNYPGKALQGEVAPRLTQTDTKKGDLESENLLIKMCIENAIESFQKIAASM